MRCAGAVPDEIGVQVVGSGSFIVVAGLLVFLAIRSRKNPLFLGGAAAFLILGRSMFIDIYPGQELFVLSSIGFTGSDLVFVAVVLGWLYAVRRRPSPRARISTIWVALGAVLALFLAVELALAFASAGEIHPYYALGTRDWFYIPLGYLLTLDMLRRFTMDEIREYVRVLSVITTCLMVLYIVSALGVPVYPYEKNVILPFGGATIIRDFSTFPAWTGLAWCYYLASPQRKGWAYAAMAVLTAGVLLSYTRSAIGWFAITAVVATALLLLRRGRRTRAIVLGVVCVALAIAVLVVGPLLAPQQFGYLQSRVSLGGNATAMGRLASFERARAAGARVDPNLGAGLFDSSASVFGLQYFSFDSDWIWIVYRTGWVGLVIFAVPLAVGLWRGIRGFARSELSGPASTVLLTGLLATLWFAGMRFTALVYVWWSAVSLLSIALVARAEAQPISRGATVHPGYGPVGDHCVSERVPSS